MEKATELLQREIGQLEASITRMTRSRDEAKKAVENIDGQIASANEHIREIKLALMRLDHPGAA